MVIVDNYYSAATGGQDVLSSRAHNDTKSTGNPISAALKGVGVEWIRQIDYTYDVAKVRDTVREALLTDFKGPKVIVASSECMLNKQRREKPLRTSAIKEGRRVDVPRFGVDADVCTGDHACIRLSGCPSLSLKRAGMIRCATIRWRILIRPVWAVAIAAKWRMPPCFAHRFIARMWCITPVALNVGGQVCGGG